ncbi:TRANSLATION INITIATION FACTOR 3 SUBUNIT 9-like protein [Carex littledalei]|uniref:TRANSLATION INITIATION FACTOR 3 SUBUNIT 9-like protein n=1 Tax=Carex littledalei TaxID=544730 RepID=A0A833R1C4_9POAL|nr:TRANSLATION INITIATION FACTOR 3 SUBUNIT 9-like protein [Carex littledalei]
MSENAMRWKMVFTFGRSMASFSTGFPRITSSRYANYSFPWRPRPPSLLSPEKEEEISRNLRKYSKKYEAEDQDVSLALSEQDRKKRRAIQEEWEAWTTRWKQYYEEERDLRMQLRDGEPSDDEGNQEEYEAKEVEAEEVLDVREEIVNFDQEQ